MALAAQATWDGERGEEEKPKSLSTVKRGRSEDKVERNSLI